MTLLKNIWSRSNYRIAFVLAVLMLLWLGSGQLVGQDEVEGPSEKEESELTRVRAQNIQAQDYTRVVALTARTEPNRAVDVRAQLGGQVIKLPHEKGALVKGGDMICELDSEDRNERLQVALAALEKAQLDYEAAQELRTSGFQARTDIAQTATNLELAKADLKRAQLDVDNLKIRAPFDGILETRPTELGDLMQVGQICGRVIDLDPLLVTGRVAETEVGYLRSKLPVEAQLITGEQVSGVIRFVERNADELTRSFRLEALVENEDISLSSGISTYLRIPVGEVRAHLVNSSLLTLDDKGIIGLKILDDQNKAKFVPVDLVGDYESGVWVTGLPEETTLITVGQQYVTEGEEVEITIVESAVQTNTDAL